MAIREFLWVAGPKASGAACQLLLNILLLRYFGPEMFGVVAVCIGGMLLSDAVLGAAFDTAILRQAPLHHDDDPIRSLQVQQAGLLLKPILGVAAAIPLVLFGNRLSHLLFQGRSSSRMLYLSAIAVMGLLLLRSVQTHFQVDRKFQRYGASDILHNSIRLGGTGALLALRWATPERVVGLYAIAPLVIALVLLATMARPLLTVPVSTSAMRELLALIKSYLPTAAVGSITTRMDLFFVSTFGSVGQAGIFAAAQTLILVPQMIGMYLGVVFSPRIMPLWKKRELWPVYRRFQRFALIACCAAYFVALPTMGRFVGAFLPASYHNSTTVALILLPAGLASFVNFPWTVSFLMFLRPVFLLKFDSIALPVLALLYAAVIPRYGAAGAATVTTMYAMLKTAALQLTARGIMLAPIEASPQVSFPQASLQPAGRTQ